MRHSFPARILKTAVLGCLLSLPFFFALTDGHARDLHAVDLDGSGDRLETDAYRFPDSTTLRSFTVEAWVYPRGAGRLISDGVYAIDMIFSGNAYFIRFTVLDNADDQKADSQSIALAAWHHVACIFDAADGTLSVAVDGRLHPAPEPLAGDQFEVLPGRYLTVGGYKGLAGSNFDGQIDDVRISSTARYTSDFDTALPDGFDCEGDGETEVLLTFDELADDPGADRFDNRCASGLPAFNATWKGDVTNEGVIDLADAVAALRVLSGLPPGAAVDGKADLSGDGRVGPQEVVYILQATGGIRVHP